MEQFQAVRVFCTNLVQARGLRSNERDSLGQASPSRLSEITRRSKWKLVAWATIQVETRGEFLLLSLRRGPLA